VGGIVAHNQTAARIAPDGLLFSLGGEGVWVSAGEHRRQHHEQRHRREYHWHYLAHHFLTRTLCSWLTMRCGGEGCIGRKLTAASVLQMRCFLRLPPPRQ
jgi:hypothetical protein